MCEQLVRSLYAATPRPGVEPATIKPGFKSDARQLATLCVKRQLKTRLSVRFSTKFARCISLIVADICSACTSVLGGRANYNHPTASFSHHGVSVHLSTLYSSAFTDADRRSRSGRLNRDNYRDSFDTTHSL